MTDGIADDSPLGLTVQFDAGIRMSPVFDVLVGVLDHDDGSVDHRTNGNGDAAERHDVGVDALMMMMMKAISTPSGSDTIATNAERK